MPRTSFAQSQALLQPLAYLVEVRIVYLILSEKGWVCLHLGVVVNIVYAVYALTNTTLLVLRCHIARNVKIWA